MRDIELYLDQLQSKFDFKSDFLFKELNPEEKDCVTKSMTSIKFSKNDLLFYEGGIPTGVYFILSGKTKKFNTSINGDKQIFYV